MRGQRSHVPNGLATLVAPHCAIAFLDLLANQTLTGVVRPFQVVALLIQGETALAEPHSGHHYLLAMPDTVVCADLRWRDVLVARVYAREALLAIARALPDPATQELQVLSHLLRDQGHALRKRFRDIGDTSIVNRTHILDNGGVANRTPSSSDRAHSSVTRRRGINTRRQRDYRTGEGIR